MRLYCDYCPSLDVQELQRNWSDPGEPLLLVWNGSNRRVGHAHLAQDDEGRLLVSWRVFQSPTHKRRGGNDSFVFRSRPSAIGPTKPLLGCPLCDASVVTVFLTDAGWACRRCHKLAYSSQRLSDIDRKEVRLNELVRHDALSPRPPRRWRSKHRRDRREAIELERSLGASAEDIVPREVEAPIRREYAAPGVYPGLRPSRPGDTGSEPWREGDDAGDDMFYNPRLPAGHAARRSP